MKKFAVILLSAVLLFTLAACSDKEEKEETKTNTDASIETTAPAEDTTAPVKEDEEKAFSTVTVVDNEYCKIEVTGIVEDLFGTALTVTAENKTADENLFFTTEACSINGVAVESAYAENITAGKKSTESIRFLDDNLKGNDITRYTDIEITFRVYNGDDWSGDDLVNEAVHIYPYGESNAESFTREKKATDVPVFDNDKVSATVIGWGEDELYDYYISFYLENKSADTEYTFDVTRCAVNGVEITPAGAFSVPAGKMGLEKLYITDSQYEDSGSTDLSDIFLSMRAFDTASWEAEDVASESVNVYPKGKDNAVQFVRETKDTDVIIADNDKITVIATGMGEDDIFGTQDLEFYFINKTDREIMFTIEDVSVNGYMMDPFFATSVMPGFSRFGDASWFNADLEENSIDAVTEIEFTMIARDANDWDAEDILSEKVIYKP